MTRRWYDSDVRSRPELIDLVTSYLTEYAGDFEFLINAKQALLTGYDLHVPVVRGVLNCMQADSSVRNMPEPGHRSFDASRHMPDLPTIVDEADAARNQRKQIKLNTRWKKTYGISKRPQAKLIHAVDTNTSALTLWSGGDVPPRFVWELNWMCNPYLYFNGRTPGFQYGSRYILLNDWESRQLLNGEAQYIGLPSRQWKVCRKCEDENDSRLNRAGRHRTS